MIHMRVTLAKSKSQVTKFSIGFFDVRIKRLTAASAFSRSSLALSHLGKEWTVSGILNSMSAIVKSFSVVERFTASSDR